MNLIRNICSDLHGYDVLTHCGLVTLSGYILSQNNALFVDWHEDITTRMIKFLLLLVLSVRHFTILLVKGHPFVLSNFYEYFNALSQQTRHNKM